MAKLVWDKVGERFYETGISHGVLYPILANGKYENGVAWNGLSAITDSSSGAEPTAVYADNAKYLSLMSVEEFNLTIEAYSYPKEFKKCIGKNELFSGISIGQQRRRAFGLSYQTILGNDVDSNDYGYKIHLVYNCLASPSEKGYQTVNDSPEAMSLSWEVSASTAEVDRFKPTSKITIEAAALKRAGLYHVLVAIEEALYGTENTAPRMLLPSDVEMIYKNQRFIKDSNDDFLVDSSGNYIASVVFEE